MGMRKRKMENQNLAVQIQEHVCPVVNTEELELKITNEVKTYWQSKVEAAYAEVKSWKTKVEKYEEEIKSLREENKKLSTKEAAPATKARTKKS